MSETTEVFTGIIDKDGKRSMKEGKIVEVNKLGMKCPRCDSFLLIYMREKTASGNYCYWLCEGCHVIYKERH